MDNGLKGSETMAVVRGFTTEGELELIVGGSAVVVGSATADKRGFTQYTEGELELISQDVITLQRAEAEEGKKVSKKDLVSGLSGGVIKTFSLDS
jgi:hypothetical protein